MSVSIEQSMSGTTPRRVLLSHQNETSSKVSDVAALALSRLVKSGNGDRVTRLS